MSSAQKYFQLIFIWGILIWSSSCLKRHFIEGQAELISIDDAALNDSSLFFGYANRVDWQAPYPYPFEVWIENTNLTSITDSMGYYSIKTVPGTYSIKCQDVPNDWPQLIEGMSNVEIKKNQKIQIDFYIGYIVE